MVVKKSRSRSRVDGKPNPNPKAKQRRRSRQPKLLSKKKDQPEVEEEPPIKQKRKQATPKRIPPKNSVEEVPSKDSVKQAPQQQQDTTTKGFMFTQLEIVGSIVSDKLKKGKDELRRRKDDLYTTRNDHKYKVYKEEDDCSVLIGRAKDNYNKDKDVLISYPIEVPVKTYGDNILKEEAVNRIFNFCFLQSELLEMVKGNKNARSDFTEPIKAEIREGLKNLGVDPADVKIEMTADFEDMIIEHSSALVSVDSAAIAKSTVFNVALNYMIGYMETTKQDVNPASFYSRIVGYGQRLVSGTLYSMKWVLSHPILSMILFLMVKLIKVVFCFWTGNVQKDMVDALVEGAFEFMGNSPLVILFKSVVKVFGECVSSIVTSTPIWSVLVCLKSSLGLLFNNQQGIVAWVMESTSRGVVWMFEKVLGDYSSVGSAIMTTTSVYTSMVKDPLGVLYTLFGGNVRSFVNKQAVIGQLTYNFAGDVNYIMLSILLELMPFKILESLLVTVIEAMFAMDPVTGVSATLKGLKEMHTWLMSHVNDFVTSMTGTKTRLSCLDLVIYIYKYSIYGKTLVMFLSEVKEIFIDVMPCLFYRIWVNLQKLFGVNVKDESSGCCMKQMVAGLKQALDQVRIPTWTEWANRVVPNWIPGRGWFVGKDGQMIYVGGDEKKVKRINVLLTENKGDKKYDVLIERSGTTTKKKSGGKPFVVVSFGQKGASDFRKHKNEERRLRYIRRHGRGRENWHDWETAGFWSRWLLWNKKTTDESIADIERRFPLKIIKSRGMVATAGAAKEKKQPKKKSKKTNTNDDELSSLLGSMKL